jgi:NADH:ubiquinone oxidoreductase subunit E
VDVVIEVTVCVGSSCHIKGSRKLIEQLNNLISQYKLEEKVILKGSFCLEHCAEGFNWKIGDTLFSSKDVKEAEAIFREKVIEPLIGKK